MSQKDKLIDKLIAKLKSNSKAFTFDGVVVLLEYFGFTVDNKGKTSGSRIMFRNDDLGLKISFHKPHPQKELKEYQMKQLRGFLEEEGLL